MEAPDSVEYLPATQSTQVLAPVVVIYLPMTQLLQTEAEAAEKVPIVQLLQTEDEATEKVPAVQLVHAEFPAIILYFPASQAEHGPELVPVNPELQTQIFCMAIVFAWHTVHEVACVLETEFCGQLLQFSVSKNSLYFPASQGIQLS